MRGIACAAVVFLLGAGTAYSQPPAATLGQPRPAAQLDRPIASSLRIRGQADDTPIMSVPEPVTLGAPGYYPTAPTVAYSPPANYPYPPPAQFSPTGYYPPPQQSYYAPPPPAGWYPPPPASYYPPAPAAVDPMFSSQPTGRSTLPGDAIRRTSFSSRRSISRSTDDEFDSGGNCFNDCCEWVKGCFSTEGGAFESDHAFDCFASPIINPFLFNDPRSLTQVKPLFIYQKIPGSNPLYQGGTIFFYGLTASVAFTDRFSVTMNKLGGISIDPSTNSPVEDSSGLAEFDLGLQYTIVRNPETGTAAALGLIFQIPIGSQKVFQDTGDFSMVPYITFGKNFGRSSYGSFNIMNGTGFAFEVGNGRSEYFYNSFHLDYDIANLHKFYPVFELSWFHYTASGNSRPVQFEGRDIANIGAFNVSGRDYVTLGPGFRWKLSPGAQLGLLAEFAVSNPQDLQNFRLTVDFIFRY